MEYLAANDYNVVALRDLPAILRRELPMPPKAVAISIDDGYRSTYEVAFPILARHGFPATLFLYSDLGGLPAGMTWSQMKEMKTSALIDIQPHSKSHANLALRQAHHWGFTRASLAALFREAGCSETHTRAYREGICPDIHRLDNRPDESIFFEAIK